LGRRGRCDPKPGSDAWLAARRQAMVTHQLRARGITDRNVLKAMECVPRHLFVPPELRLEAYEDYPLSIGFGQTISQPYIVALMTQSLELRGGERVLELGTGSGYQAAVLSRLAREVVTVERSPELSRSAAARLARLGYHAVRCVLGDGTLGLPEEAPFDRVVATGSLPGVPEALVARLTEGGLLVAPVGDRFWQELLRVRQRPTRRIERLGGCRFVPLIGEGGWEGPP